MDITQKTQELRKSLSDSINTSNTDPAMNSFLTALKVKLKLNQIIDSGSEYELLSKDPATNSIKPFSFIYPESLSEIQSLVSLANNHNIKLWVYSTGKNWGYLNTSGSTSENSVVVLLNRMNKIHLVDEELGYAVIEPGVTYEQLSKHLLENNIALWTDSPGGPPTGSVIGNALDRGVGVTKYGDHFAHLCGYEVVLADGQVINTGVATDDGKKGASHLYKWGVGPYVEGLFSQSNYGIVTKAGIWLMKKPKDYKIFSLGIKDNDALAKTMDTVRDLMLKGVLHEVGRFSNDLAILTLLTQAFKEGLDFKTAVSSVDLQELKKKYHVPGWTCSFVLYGEKPIVDASSRVAHQALKKLGPNVKINSYSKAKAHRIVNWIKNIDSIKSSLLHKVIDFGLRKWLNTSFSFVRLFPGLVQLHEGRPVETVVRRGYFRYKTERPVSNIHVGRDDLGVLWSVPVLPFKGKEVVTFSEECEALFKKFNFDFYMTTMIFNARSVCPLMVILYDRLDQDECRRAQMLYEAILDLSHKRGYQHFRAGINGWKKLYQFCPGLKSLNDKIKEALDPSGVFSPGRYGIDNKK